MGSFVNFKDFVRHGGHGTVALSPQRFRIALPIEEVLGPDFTRRVEGVRRIGGFGSTEWADVDFGDGRVVAIYEIQTDGQVRLITLYPEGD